MYKYFLLILWLFFGAITLQARYFSFNEIPAWVKPIDISEKSNFTKYEISSGFYLKIADYQYNLSEEAIFYHEVRNVVFYSGITNASQLSVTYDTNYQKLTIHHLYIWRKGIKIDRTNDLSLEILNNEYNLNSGIYNGSITAYENLNDIRKDDLIDFAYTLKGDNPIFNHEKFLMIPMVSDNPIDHVSIRILYPKDKDYIYKCVNCDSLDINISETDGYKQIEIVINKLKAFQYEQSTPSWIIPYGYFILSSLKSWTDVNNWAQDVFAFNGKPDLNEVFKEVFSGNENMDGKINKIINYVQDEIRYMGIEAGIGSIKPFPPEQVVKQRFGDCKDKSLLLVALLKQIGINEAYPVLVNTYLTHTMTSLYPNNQIFNHCIVTFDYNDTTYWVDPSITTQGGDFRDLYTPDYDKVLIIGQPSDSLQRMSSNVTTYATEITEEMDIKSFSEPAQYSIISKRYGYDADVRRTMLEYYSSQDLSTEVMKDLKLLFPTVDEVKDLEIIDDPDSNKIITQYLFKVGGFWEDKNIVNNGTTSNFWYFKFEPLTIYDYINISACEERKTDFALIYPLKLHFKMIIHFPKDLLFNDQVLKYDNNAFYFEEKVEQINSNTIQLYYILNIKSESIKANEYKDICEQKNLIVKNLPIAFYFPK